LQIFDCGNGGNKQLKPMTTNGIYSKSGVMTGSGKSAEGVVLKRLGKEVRG